MSQGQADIRAASASSGQCLATGPNGWRCTVSGPHSVHQSTNSVTGEVYDQWSTRPWTPTTPPPSPAEPPPGG